MFAEIFVLEFVAVLVFRAWLFILLVVAVRFDRPVGILSLVFIFFKEPVLTALCKFSAPSRDCKREVWLSDDIFPTDDRAELFVLVTVVEDVVRLSVAGCFFILVSALDTASREHELVRVFFVLASPLLSALGRQIDDLTDDVDNWEHNDEWLAWLDSESERGRNLSFSSVTTFNSSRAGLSTLDVHELEEGCLGLAILEGVLVLTSAVFRWIFELPIGLTPPTVFEFVMFFSFVLLTLSFTSSLEVFLLLMLLLGSLLASLFSRSVVCFVTDFNVLLPGSAAVGLLRGSWLERLVLELMFNSFSLDCTTFLPADDIKDKSLIPTVVAVVG